MTRRPRRRPARPADAARRGAGRAGPPGQPELPLRREVGHARHDRARRLDPQLRRPRCCCTTRATRTSRSSATRTTSRTPRSRRTGRSLVNTNSKAYYLNEDRQGDAAVPQDLPSEPAWKELSKSGRFEWHDHRTHWMGEGDPPKLTDKNIETVIDDNWQIPIAVGGTKGDDHRHADVGPARQGGLPLGAIFGFAALIIVLSIAVFIVAAAARGEPSEGRGDRRGVVRRAVASSRSSRGLVAPASAFAHATLQSTVPERGAKLDTPPSQVVSASTRPSRRASARCACSTRRATRSRPARRSTRAARAPRSRSSSSPASATAPTRRPTASCPPTATPVSSGFVFTVGEAAAPAESLDQLLAAEGDAGPVTNTALSVARGFQYAAIAARPRRADLLPLLLAAAPGVSRGPSPRGWSGSCCSRRSPASCPRSLAVILQGAIGEGATVLVRRPAGHVRRGPRHPLRPRLGHRRRRLARRARRAGHPPAAEREVSRLPRRRPGRLTPPSSGGVATCRRTRRRPCARSPSDAAVKRGRRAGGPPLRARRSCPPWAATRACSRPSRCCMPANVLHVLAMAAWLGGIAVLVFALRAATAGSRPSSGRRCSATVVGRFSTLAGLALPSCSSSRASSRASIEVGSCAALLDTPFGRAVLIKIVVAIAIIALGASTGRRSCRLRKRPDRTRPARPACCCGGPWSSSSCSARSRSPRPAPSRATRRPPRSPAARSRRPSTSARRGRGHGRPGPGRPEPDCTSTCSTARPARRSRAPRSSA